MITVCVFADPKLSAAMMRVADALAAWAPDDVQITPRAQDAELVVLHVIGHPETVTAVQEIRARGARYAIMQYCLRSTQEPNTGAWLDLWRGAEVVWSYYDLDAAIVEDGYSEQTCPWCDEELPHLGQGTGATDFPRCFYFAPLGVDVATFFPVPTAGERYAILTSGYVAESECVEECTEAAARLGRRTYHLGPHLECHQRLGNADVNIGIYDPELRQAYSRSDFVAGLRRIEGFEMPAAEGLLCGARPIMFDRPHYRQWFEPWAVFVPETDPATLTDELERVMARRWLDGGKDQEPVTLEEMKAARERFNWQPLVEGFWRRALRNL